MRESVCVKSVEREVIEIAINQREREREKERERERERIRCEERDEFE